MGNLAYTDIEIFGDLKSSLNKKNQNFKVLKAKKFPFTTKFQTLGNKYLQMSNNISSIIFNGSKENALNQQVYYAKLNEKIINLQSYSFYNCYNLVSIDLDENLQTIDDHCFNGCKKLIQIELPVAVQKLGDWSLANCQKLNKVYFNCYDYDVDDPAYTFEDPFYLQYIGSTFIANSKLTSIIIPQSINSLSKIDSNALSGSNINEIYFLGMNGSDLDSIKDSNCLGRNENCTIYSKDFKKYTYLNSSKTLTEVKTYDMYQGVKVGRCGALRLRKLNLFDIQCVNWCNDYNTRTTETKKEKFPQVNCPFIVIYLDLMTSSPSRNFLANILINKEFSTMLKENFNCYFFLLSRNADFTYEGLDEDNILFKNLTGNSHSRDFISINFFYNGQFKSVTVDSNITVSSLKNIMIEYASNAGFDSFDYEPFDIKLEEPYVEEIPTTGSDVSTTGYIPWWYSNGTITNITETF